MAAALLVTACTRASKPDDVAHSDLPPDTAFRVHPHVGASDARLSAILTPPGELPVWSCEGRASHEDFRCPAATDWYRGPGVYELMLELKTGQDVLRGIHTLEVTDDAPADVSVWLVEAPKPHLEVGAGRGGSLPSEGASGALTRAQILAGVKAREPEVRGCYAGALQDAPALKARIEAWFLIGPDGKVTGASARGAPQSPELVYCVLSKVRAFTFAKPKGGALAVTYPFVFSP